MAIVFTDDELKAMKIENRVYRDTAIKSSDPFDESNAERFSLSAHWVGITCGNYNADVAANFAGKKGSGKSYGSLELARLCAIRISAKLNNDDGAGWKDYFDVERNVAVMDAEKLIEILTSNEKHQVIIGDDVGTIQGARQYRSEQNQLMNNVFVVNRTLNNIYLSSAPESKHVDRQARDLPEHQLDFQRNEALMSVGFSMCKYFSKITDPKTSDSYHAYNYWRGAKVARIIIPKPPKEMCEAYDHLREIGKNKVQEALKTALEENGNPKPSETKKVVLQEKLTLAQTIMDKYRNSDIMEKVKMKEIAEKCKVSIDTVRKWKADGKITQG